MHPTIKCLISVQAYAPRFSKICHGVRLIGDTVRNSIMGHMSVCTIIWKYYHCSKLNAVRSLFLLGCMLIRGMYATNFGKLRQAVRLFGSLRLLGT